MECCVYSAALSAEWGFTLTDYRLCCVIFTHSDTHSIIYILLLLLVDIVIYVDIYIYKNYVMSLNCFRLIFIVIFANNGRIALSLYEKL